MSGLEPSLYPFDLEEFASKGDRSQGSLLVCFRELGAQPLRLLCDMAYGSLGDSFHTTPLRYGAKGHLRLLFALLSLAVDPM